MLVALTGLPIGYSVIVALTGLPIGYSVIVALTGLSISVDKICLKPEDKKQRRDVCYILEQFIKVIYCGKLTMQHYSLSLSFIGSQF